MRFGGAHKAIFGATISGFTPPATYSDDWLTDGNLNYPGYQSGGSLSATASFSSRQIDAAVVANHRIRQAASITTGIGAIATNPWPADDIPRNWGILLASPVTISSLSLAVTGNTDPVIIGELWAGLTSKFPDFQHGTRLSPQAPFLWEGEYESLAPQEAGVAAQRRRTGRITLTDAQFEELDEVFLSQRLGKRPIMYMDNDLEEDDMWMCQFSYDAEHREGWHHVELQITEIPRTEW
jgi:hypothetical protein